jgi:hypothetical protein
MRTKSLLSVLFVVAICGLVAAGCGDDGDSSSTGEITDIAVPENAQDALDQAEQQLEDAPETIDQAVQQCIDAAESSNLPGDQVDSLKQLCEDGGDAASQALENAPGG